MVVTGGLFAGATAFIAWERVPAWRAMDDREFQRHFGHSIRKADRLQPALLVLTLVGAAAFATTTAGTARALAAVAAVALALTLMGSGVYLVPLQRRLLAGTVDDPNTGRLHWYRGHLLRATVAVSSFTLLAVAAQV